MGINLYNIKKWSKMVSGKSIFHVNQGKGKIYSIKTIKGYYNDLTEKVTKDSNFNSIEIPKIKIETGEDIFFSIAIFQYGLGAYDLFLLENKSLFLEKFRICLEWAYNNQEKNGAWETFKFKDDKFPYSAMAQGEGISLLLRGYLEFNDEKYLIAAKKAVEYLITPIENCGTTKYINDQVFFQEYVNKPTVLNGWIFSLFGVYDYLKIIEDDKIKNIYKKSIDTLVACINNFDNGYWTKYDLDNMIASPFYHKLHISQMEVMYEITEQSIFKEYAEKWTYYQNNWINRKRAFIIKAYQKLIEK